ncbi:MAG TPA: hypothetical protein VGK67_04610 [Myxococcales bacterium]|jgi:FtsH-binding integral membrane protein
MSPTPAERYRTARELASALETFVSTALLQKPAGWTTWLARGLITLVGLPILVGAIVGLVIAPYQQMGPVFILAVVLAAGGVGMAVLEAATRGRHSLLGMGLFVALATLVIGARGGIVGVISVMKVLRRPGCVSAAGAGFDPESESRIGL